jgi:transposase
MKILACDVSKDFLTPYAGKPENNSPNNKEGIRKLLLDHPEHIVACEATSSYHLELVEAAYNMGREVFVVNPKEARNYKDSMSFRAKTDPLDARYLYEFISRNHDLLRPYTPICQELLELKALISQRALVQESKVAMAASFGKETFPEQEAALSGLADLIRSYEKRIKEIACKYESYKRVLRIPGVGPIIACALVFVLESRAFASAESVIAFLGLDVRIRQSGHYKGKPKLTKRGDPVLRYLLCIAGRCLLTSKLGRAKKIELVARGRHLPERMVIGARKVLRTAWHLHNTKVDFDPEKWTWGLTERG